MVDGWMGDDWYHYGALRQTNFDYFAHQIEQKGEGSAVPRSAYDDYETFLAAGSPANYATANGFDQLGWWRKMLAHPSYDAFWQAQALDKQLAAHPSNVPTLWEQGLWDQGGHLGSEPRLAGTEGGRSRSQQLAGTRAVVPQPGQSLWLEYRPTPVARRHGAPISP